MTRTAEYHWGMWRDWLPDEWIASIYAGAELRSAAFETSRPWRKFFVGFILPVALGAVAGYIAPVPGAFAVGATMAFLGVMIGFILNLMLATGRVLDVNGLEVHEFDLIYDRVQHMFWSQTATLSVLIISVGSGGLLLLLAKHAPVADQHSVWTVLFFGTVLCSLIRTLILPFQLVDVHKVGFEAKRRLLIDRANRELDEELNSPE